MYNRYIPQPDGSYRRSRIPDPQFHPHQSEPDCKCEDPQPVPPCQSPPPPNPCPPARPQGKTNARPRPATYHNCQCKQPKPEPQPNDCHAQVSSFLRNLLPRNFDTGDLLIVLLLLLMAGDCPEDQNSALLTLALYFIM